MIKSKSLIFSWLCWATLGLTGWYLYHVAGLVHDQFIVGDINLAPALDQAIKNLLNQNKYYASQDLFLDLKAHYPMVSQLNIKRTGIAKKFVKVTAQDLKYRLGNNFVLTDNQEVFLTNSFSSLALKAIPNIHLHTVVEVATEIEPEQKFFLKNLSELVVQDYEIHWYGINQIVLISKENSKLQIIVRYDQDVTSELLTTCHKLLATYQSHTNKKCVGIIKIDLRFEQQIIVSC